MSETHQIFVLDTTPSGSSRSNVDETEIDIIYKQLRVKNPLIAPYVLDIVKSLEVEILDETIASNIPAMLIKNIIGNVSIISSSTVVNKEFTLPIQFNSPLLTHIHGSKRTKQYAPHSMINAVGYIFDINARKNPVFRSFARRPSYTGIASLGLVSNYLYHPSKNMLEYTFASAPSYNATYSGNPIMFKNSEDAIMQITSTQNIID